MTNITVKDGVLHFAGQSTVPACAQQYRHTAVTCLTRTISAASAASTRRPSRGTSAPTSRPLFASKACCFTRIYEIMREEGMGIDVVSPGEIYTARRAGFDLRGAYFHGNNKTDADIAFAMECGVGCFVADGREELDAIEREAARRGLRQKVLLRLTPGIDPHTYEAVATGKVDSKFGAAIETGQAEQLALHALELPHVELMGFHCHVGSQVFGEDIFERAAPLCSPLSRTWSARTATAPHSSTSAAATVSAMWTPTASRRGDEGRAGGAGRPRGLRCPRHRHAGDPHGAGAQHRRCGGYDALHRRLRQADPRV